MHDVFVLTLVVFFGLLFCVSIAIGFRWVGRKIDKSNNAIAVRLKIEFEFLRLALNLEKELGILASAHYGLINEWPPERMKQAIQEEKRKYLSDRTALVYKYETRFKELDEQCRGVCPNFVQGLIELNAEIYPSLGLLSPNS